MNPHKRARFLEGAALREAQKAIRRRGGEPLTRDDLLALRVQTLSCWVRMALVAGGLVIAGGSIVFVLPAGELEVGALLILLSFFLICFGALGWRSTLSTCLKALADGLPELVIRAVLSALD